MSLKAQYSRYFINLTNDEISPGKLNASVRGQARFEINADQCTLRINIEHLEPCKPGFSYKCYLISSETDKSVSTCLGNIELLNHKASFTTKFPRNDVNNTGVPIEKFNVIAVACQPESTCSPEDVTFPLSGFKGQKTTWKNKLKARICSDSSNFETENTRSQTVPETNKEAIEGLASNQSIPKTSDAARLGINHNFVPFDFYSQFNITNSKKHSNEWKEFLDDCNVCKENKDKDLKSSSVSLFNTNSTEKIKNLENLLSMSLPECKPFSYSKDSVRWWKVKSHQLLKRVLQSSGYLNLIMVNSFLNTSYYIYGYYIVGIDYCNDMYSFIYGIPSLFGIDPKPNNLPCIWKSENNNGELYGEFGYWLVRFDISNENLL